MTVPVWVEQLNGTFTASVPGMPQLTTTADTKDKAVAALVATLADRQTRGELVLVNVPPPSPRSSLEGESETWDEIVEEIYRHRAELKAQEFPE